MIDPVFKTLVLTLENRERSLVNRRFLCQSHEEIIDHILLHCDKTRVLWELFLSFFGVTWVFPTSVRRALEGDFCGQEEKGGFEGWALMAFFFLLFGG